MLDLACLANAGLHSSPFAWGLVDGCLNLADVARLFAAFPTEDFVTFRGYDGEKQFDQLTRPLVVLGTRHIYREADLDHVWSEFAADILSPGYTEAMEQLTGLDLSRAAVEINLWRWETSFWIGAHADLPDKFVTQIFYLNPQWLESWGGSLRILGSRDNDDVVTTVAPDPERSVVIVRSDESWHAVAPVTTDEHRLTVQVVFHDRTTGRSHWANRPAVLAEAFGTGGS